MNCKYRLLHANDAGYVTQCEGCRKIQMAYGSMLFQISEEEFVQFKNFITCELEKYSDYGFPSEKTFVYSTDSSKVRMIFSLIEMRELDDLLIQSYLMFEVLNTCI